MKMVINFNYLVQTLHPEIPNMLRRILSLTSILLLFLLFLNACSAPPGESSTPGGKLKVVATTTLVGDIVRNIGGERLIYPCSCRWVQTRTTLSPLHRDVALVSDADLIFTNGAGLESFMTRLLENAGAQATPVSLSDGLELIPSAEEETHAGETEISHEDGDPHVWMDPEQCAALGGPHRAGFE